MALISQNGEVQGGWIIMQGTVNDTIRVECLAKSFRWLQFGYYNEFAPICFYSLNQDAYNYQAWGLSVHVKSNCKQPNQLIKANDKMLTKTDLAV